MCIHAREYNKTQTNRPYKSTHTHTRTHPRNAHTNTHTHTHIQTQRKADSKKSEQIYNDDINEHMMDS